MSDFLSQLVSHHFQPENALRPRPASLFEPTADLGAKSLSAAIFNFEQPEAEQQEVLATTADQTRSSSHDDLAGLKAALQQIRQQLGDTRTASGSTASGSAAGDKLRQGQRTEPAAVGTSFAAMESGIEPTIRQTQPAEPNGNAAGISARKKLFETGPGEPPRSDNSSRPKFTETPAVFAGDGAERKLPPIMPANMKQRGQGLRPPVEDGPDFIDDNQAEVPFSAAAKRPASAGDPFADKPGETAHKKITAFTEPKPLSLSEPNREPPIPQQTVQVTIGRIEIRATAAATRQPAAAKPAALSLDDYLNKRNGERR